MSEKKVLLEVEVRMTEALKELVQYKMRVEEIDKASAALKARIKEEGDQSGALRTELARLGEERKAYNKLISESSRQIQNQITAGQTYEGTLKGLAAQLSAAKEQLRAMKTTDPGFAAKAAEVDALNQQVKDLEASYGVHTRDVGNYQKATNVLKGELADLLGVLKNVGAGGSVMEATASSLSKQAEELKSRISEIELAIRSTGDTQSEEGQQMNAQLEELKEQLGEVDGALEELGEKNSLDDLNQSFNVLTSSVNLLQSGFALVGAESAELQAVLNKLVAVTKAMDAAQKLAEATQKKSTITTAAALALQKVGINQTLAQSKAQAAATAYKNADNVVTKVATGLQWAWNAALAANPVMLIVVGIVALVAAGAALVKWLGSSETATDKANKAQKAYEEQCKATQQAVDAAALAEMQRAAMLTKEYSEELTAMMKRGASKEELAKKEAELAQKLTESEIQGIKDRQEAEKKAEKDAEAYYKTLQAGMEQARAEAQGLRKFDEEQFNEYKERVAEAQKLYEEAKATRLQSEQELAQKQQQQAKADYDARQQQQEQQKALRDKAFAAEQARYDRDLKLRQTHLKTANTYIYDQTLTQEENNARKFKSDMKYAAESLALTQQAERDKLAMKLKFGQITRAAYDEEMAALRQQQQADTAQLQTIQLAQTEDFMRKLSEQARALAGGGGLDEQLDAVKSKYAAAHEAIRNDATLSADERAFYERRLAEKQAAEIKQLRIQADEEMSREITEQTEERYRDDVRNFSESVREQLQLEADKLRTIIEARKQAGLDTQAEEAALRQVESNQRAAQLNLDLLQAGSNAREKSDIRRAYLEQELASGELTAERRAELEQELSDVIIEQQRQRVAAVEQWASQAVSLASGVNDLMNALGDAEVQKAEKSNDDQKKSLEKRLKAGMISQKEYDKQVASLDADLDAKKKKIALEQARREKALSIFQIGLNTAMAIMKIWAEVPKADFGAMTLVLTGIAASMGALQLATALAAPLPTARKGGRISGATHEQGGVLVNTEDEERIISAAPAKAFPELLNLISYIGKHGAGIPETGFAVRAATAGHVMASAPAVSAPDYEQLARSIGDCVGERMAGELRGLKVYLSVTELREAEKEYAKIEQGAKI